MTDSLLFVPATAGDHTVSREARICSLAMHMVCTLMAVKEDIDKLPSDRHERLLAGAMLRLGLQTMSLYPDRAAVDTIYALAKDHGLEPHVPAEGGVH